VPTTFAMDRAAVADFCRRHHVRRLGLFGSVLRDARRRVDQEDEGRLDEDLEAGEVDLPGGAELPVINTGTG